MVREIGRQPVSYRQWSSMAGCCGAAAASRDSKANPRRAVEWLQRAAEAGSLRAMYWLGNDLQLRGAAPLMTAQLALLWYGRAAEAGYSDAQVKVAQIMEEGVGLPNPQPEIAERYWRLAAHHGNAFAQVEFADKLRNGLLLVKEEYGETEVITTVEAGDEPGLRAGGGRRWRRSIARAISAKTRIRSRPCNSPTRRLILRF